MDNVARIRFSRRRLQHLALVLPAPLALAALRGRSAGITLAQGSGATAEAAATPVLVPTPTCADDDDIDETLPQTAGPFFTPDSPERTSLLEAGMPGTPLTLAGYVYSVDCQPVEGALIDFWQADDMGVYDNTGYTLRGHQFTDDEGRYQLETIVPGLYPGRTRHIHVKVQAPDQPVLTTQLYFPDVEQNSSDGIFDPSLVVDLQSTEEGAAAPTAQPGSTTDSETGFFTFVLAVT